MTPMQEYIHKSKYARWLDGKNRRETWSETVDRYMSIWVENPVMTRDDLAELREAIFNMEVMPSMRAMMSAGKALKQNNIAAYNCAALAVTSPLAFDETLYVLMHGTGVGFSVERQYIKNLPKVADTMSYSETTIVVEDSKEGWQLAYRELISALYSGRILKWDVSKVRKAGARLLTFGGRASGPQALVELFQFTIEVFKGAVGRNLTSYECHSLMCKIAEIVVVGGVRRSALISLSNLSDQRMRDAKSGNWWIDNPHLRLSNNSVAYTEKPEVLQFLDEWRALVASRSGERGIFNREAVVNLQPARRKILEYYEFLTNPCSEIALRDMQFCNLTEVVARRNDTKESLLKKVRYATILGTLQSTLTDFKNLRPEWSKNCEEERLLGVSITGIMDCPLLRDIENTPSLLRELKEYAISVNKEWSEKLGVNPSTAITCVKPSGTVSLLTESSSGLHARHAKQYIRTVRSDNKDPLTQLMKDCGIYNEPCVSKPETTTIFSFPVIAPDDSICRNDLTAIEQLELWKMYQLNWCEHKPSVTIYVSEDEWVEVGAWVWKNFDILSGVSFLPRSEHSYKQAPLQDASMEDIKHLLDSKIEWSLLSKYELEDCTISTKELACTGSACEIV